ncbi:hypothetical protein [Kineosporia succinea]|uniref:Integral membrane protein n=1 Tax=Kineosporia succinea TaxID=84632 RepID=A0ABT9PCT1_9ACTN|nr:hypothetical protein [Kineosporia succinea]MDP9830524.1 hypothetical protein [Kineosporia succinea]
MSAPSMMEPTGAGPVRIPLSGARTVLPGLPGWAGAPATAVHRRWNGHERRSRERLRRLSRDYDALCTSAVDAAEIAAGLEASGFTDGSAREYGYPGVFGLAEALFRLTPRLADRRPGRLANPWAERPLRHLARGLTFALPGLVLVACLPALSSGADRVTLVLAMLLGWPASQAMAFLGYSLEGRRHPRAAAAVLLLGLCVSALVAGLLALAAHTLGASAPVVAIAAAEIVYVTSAAVVLVLGNELIVLGALVPGVVAAACSRWVPGLPDPVLVAGAVSSVALVLVAALAICAGARIRDLRGGFRVLTRHDLTEVVFHLGYGLAGGVLVTLPALGGSATAAGGLALLPVIWSMGGAEWSVVWLRRRSFDLLNETISVPGFQRSVRRLALTGTVRYLLQLTVLTGLLVAGFRLTGGALPDRPLTVALLAGWLLGGGLYLALTLSSLSGVRTVVPCLLLAVAVGLAAHTLLTSPFAMLAAPVALVIALAPALRRTVADPVRHM